MRPHAFRQIEFGFPLGPRDGRFLIRAAIGAAANAALAGELGQAAAEAVAQSIGRMEAALAARRLGGAG